MEQKHRRPIGTPVASVSDAIGTRQRDHRRLVLLLETQVLDTWAELSEIAILRKCNQPEHTKLNNMDVIEEM